MKEDHTNYIVVDGGRYLHPTKGWRKAPLNPKKSKRFNDKLKAKRFHLENISIDPSQVAIDSLTNNQRHHWSKSGHPKGLKKIKAFANGRRYSGRKKG